MYSRTSDAEEDTEVPAGPPGTLAVTVHTVLVVLVLEHPPEDGLHLLLHHLLPLLLRPRLAAGHPDQSV